jgi:hypothetical protein
MMIDKRLSSVSEPQLHQLPKKEGLTTGDSGVVEFHILCVDLHYILAIQT